MCDGDDARDPCVASPACSRKKRCSGNSFAIRSLLRAQPRSQRRYVSCSSIARSVEDPSLRRILRLATIPLPATRPADRPMAKHYLLASDFDQTLSFSDSGIVLTELLGTSGFGLKVAGLARTNLVQQGGELAYLLLHHPDDRPRREGQL